MARQRITVSKELRLKAIAEYFLVDKTTKEDIAKKYNTSVRNVNNWITTISSRVEDVHALGQAMHKFANDNKIAQYLNTNTK